jgi:phenylacetate-coenzyme A ligase PaaK-like adenylate-forming protein
MRFDLAALDEILRALLRGEDVLPSARLTPESQSASDLRRFRLQAARAAAYTDYYGQLFRGLEIDPTALTTEEIARIPITKKEPLREQPYDFVARDVVPVFRTMTTGTTGKPTSTHFSEHELETYYRTAAIANVSCGDILPEDVVLSFSSSRATLGNTVGEGECRKIGALRYQGGIVEPELALSLLTEEHRVPGKRSRVSQISIYSSYLGELIECGLRLGYEARDFGLRRIDVGGEVVTGGLIERAKLLFGDVPILRGFGMTETWPGGAETCPEGHYHFAPGTNLREVLDLETDEPVEPGGVGHLVGTPLPPYRETTLLLRYDTEDVVRTMTEPCAVAPTPAFASVEGKARLSVRHDDGWTFPRHVIGALEAVDAVSLPARCGFWAADGGVAVEVVARDTAAVRGAIEDSLGAYGVPLRELHLRADRSGLVRPYPWRCDLREESFAKTPQVVAPAPVPA